MSQISNIATQLGSGLKLVRYTFTYLDLQAISGSGAKSITLAALIKSHGILLGVRVVNENNFAGGSLSAMTLLVGKSGTTNFFTAAYDIFAAEGDTTVQETSLFKHGQLTALDVLVTFTPTGDSVSVATQGQVSVDFLLLNPSSDMTTIP